MCGNPYLGTLQYIKISICFRYSTHHVSWPARMILQMWRPRLFQNCDNGYLLGRSCILFSRVELAKLHHQKSIYLRCRQTLVHYNFLEDRISNIFGYLASLCILILWDHMKALFCYLLKFHKFRMCFHVDNISSFLAMVLAENWALWRSCTNLVYFWLVVWLHLKRLFDPFFYIFSFPSMD